MKFLKIFFTLFAAIIFCSRAFAQNDIAVLNQIMAKTARVYSEHPIEKVYLHFDKPYYAVGDTIWFKAYLTINRHLPSLLSKVIYVDMISPHDSLVQSLKLQVKNGVAWGNMPLLQTSYKKGNYRVVAYTNYMNNNGIAYFFNKNITIGDAINNAVSTQISLKSTVVNKVPKITAGIYYKDDEGNPYADKKISWTIQKEDEEIGKGKAVTDKNGYVDINFIDLKKVGLDSATMVTVIDYGSRKQSANSFSLKPVARPDDIQFFPEGGQLILGLRTKIAFKAVKPDGLGIDVSGSITDNNNNPVAEFSSSHLGMGIFAFTPQDGKTYTAKVTFADGTTATPDLPKIVTGGVDLGLDNSNSDVLTLKIQSDSSFRDAYAGKPFFILAKSSGVICFAAKTILKDQIYSAPIPKSKFPTGIVQVTLFTFEGEPITERVAFIQHNDQLNLSISGDHPSYKTRQMVKLTVKAKNNDQPDEGNFSVSVVDESKVPFDENAESTILTNLLLTSDIKGYIEKPNYYFNHPDAKTAADLDVLLLTQGYRRFSYDEILSDKYPPIRFGAEQGIDITGTLRGSNGIPVNKGNVHISIPDKNYYANTVTDADGRFRFANLVFRDSAKVILSARDNPHASDLAIIVDGEQPQNIPFNVSEPDEITNIDTALSSYLKNSKIRYTNTHVLKEVVIKDTRIIKTSSHRDYGNLVSLGDQPDHLIRPDQLNGCNSLIDCIKVLAMGMTYDNENFYVLSHYNAGKRIPVQIFVRGMPVEPTFLAGIDVRMIESIEIFLKDDLGLVNSTYGSDGAIVVNMRKLETTKISFQQLKELMPLKNEVTYYPKGYEPVRTFYLPRYSGPRESQPGQVDTRSTIYWNPNVTTDKTGSATFEYFNADGRGNYRVTVEGLDKDGNLGRQVFRYMVN